jgi:hypothetical protein
MSQPTPNEELTAAGWSARPYAWINGRPNEWHWNYTHPDRYVITPVSEERALDVERRYREHERTLGRLKAMVSVVPCEKLVDAGWTATRKVSDSSSEPDTFVYTHDRWGIKHAISEEQANGITQRRRDEMPTLKSFIREQIYSAVSAERKWQEENRPWPPDITEADKYVICSEEDKECAEAVQEKDPKKLKDELVQSMASRLRWLESIWEAE